MKKFMFLFALMLSLALLTTSCKDEDDSTGPSDLKIGQMTATVGGASFEAQNALFYNVSGQVSGAEVDITNPINGTTKTVSVVLQKTTEVEAKTYTAICFYQETTGLGTGGSTQSWNDVNGSCEVTEVTDEEIKGTFTFTGKNDDDGTTKAVSGSFYVQRQ